MNRIFNNDHPDDQPLDIEAMLRAAEKIPFQPSVTYGEHGDLVYVFLLDVPTISVQVNERITVMYGIECGRLAGLLIHGAQAMVLRHYGELIDDVLRGCGKDIDLFDLLQLVVREEPYLLRYLMAEPLGEFLGVSQPNVRRVTIFPRGRR